MRPSRIVVLAVLIASQLALLPGCTTPVPATVTLRPSIPLKADPVIFLQAKAQWERIAESLRDAGLRTTNQFSDADYALDVRVGRSRVNKPCGGLSNVAYIVNSSAGGRMMVIKGRGGTGTCSPNVFDDMSQTLASFAN